MRLVPTEEQAELRSMLRSVFAKECPPGVIRQWKDADAESFPESLWKALADVGVFGLAVPEEHGGAGASLNELAIFYSEAGRALCPSVVYSTIAFGIALKRLGTPQVCDRYLPMLAGGALRAGVSAWDAADARSLRPTLRAARADGGWTLHGVLPFVENADLVEALLTTAFTSVDAEPDRMFGFLVEPGGPGWSSTRQPTIAGEHQCRVELDGCFVPDERVLAGTEGTGLALGDLQWVADVVTALACVEMAGGGAAVLERTVEYVSTREQFGRPIGSFQAVQHIVADIHIALEGARLTAASAVWWLARGERAGRNVAIAKMHASEAYKWATLNAHQVHGGMGYVRETDLHLWSERAKVAEIRGGTADVAARWLEEEIGLVG
ncbi:acyl-CoA dehydrogenase family protein [Rhodococcus sp. GXMU-t2271]|uniref:acyl-CoA dehydrogenase family protein n=1 Tax=Rhodococcus sp. GXMU-t2271 TaxID=3059079 RepID=UPI003529EF82